MAEPVLYLRIKRNTDIKAQIIKEIDALDQNALQDFYGLFLNFLNGHGTDDEWNNLSSPQRTGLLDALKQVENEQTLSHHQLKAKYKNRYPDA